MPVIGEAFQEFLESCPPIEEGYCPGCEEEGTWLIQRETSEECYFCGHTIEEAQEEPDTLPDDQTTLSEVQA